MKKAPKEITDKIRKAAKEGKITYAEAFTVEEYEPELRRLLPIFGQDFDECFISDESRVSDFASCGDHDLTVEQCYEHEPVDLWMDWLREKVFIRFGVRFTGNPELVELAAQIREKGDIGSGLT